MRSPLGDHQRGDHPGAVIFEGNRIVGWVGDDDIGSRDNLGHAPTGALELQLPDSVELWRYLILLALLSTVVAFAALISGLRVLGPVRTSIIATIEPFFTAMLGVVLLGQPLSRNTVSGGVLIASAVILLQFAGRNSVKEQVAA